MMIGLRMGSSSSLNQEIKLHGMIMDDRLEADDGFDSIPSSSEVSSDGGSSSEADSTDEAASASASSASPPPSSSSSASFSASSSSGQLVTSPLLDMSSLIHQLPLKRGLSSYFQGKSQSFTSLADVRCLEDLVKQENPYNKKLKSCRSYGGLSESQGPSSSSPSSSSRSHLPKSTSSSRFFPKRTSSSSSLSSRVSCSLLGGGKKSPIQGFKLR
ncbi:hypothetical protein U1Q18_039856 [Sarracenia purpurea var. burkii]